jgi:hypothetical protein
MCVLGHSEKEHCEELVQRMLPLLSQRGIEYKVRNAGSSLSTNVSEATAWGAQLYVPIHTNAASGMARGTRFGFYPGRRDSQDACKVFRDNFKKIYPLPDKVITTTYNFAEAKNPKCPSVYCETVFHDNRQDAEWFHTNMDRIAQNFVESISELLGVVQLDYIVRMEIRKDENAQFFGVPVGTVVSLPLEEYLLGVVSAEIGNAHIEACKAQAIAARSLQYRWTKNGIITDTTTHQSYRGPRSVDPAYSNAHQAVKETEGVVLMYKGEIASTFYADSNGGKMVACHEHWAENIPYLVTKDDPWTLASGKPFNGHPVGMSQQGAIWAAEHGIGHKDILAFYYPGTTLSNEKEPAEVIYQAKVETVNPLSLNIWNNIFKGASLKKVPRGDVVNVLEEVSPDWAKVEHGGVIGYSDRQYLVKLYPPAPEPIDYKAFALELSGIADRLRVISAALEG